MKQLSDKNKDAVNEVVASVVISGQVRKRFEGSGVGANWPLHLLAEEAGLPLTEVKEAMYKGAVWFEKRRPVKKTTFKQSNADIWQVADDRVASNVGDSSETNQWVTGLNAQFNKPRRIRRLRAQLKEGDRLTLYFNRQVLCTECLAPVLVDDRGDYSVWDKPAKMRCQGSKWGDHTTLNRWFEVNSDPPKEAFIVHRLDRMATGLVLLAHTKMAAASLSAKFESRQVEKRYQVIVHGRFEKPLPCRVDTAISGKAACTIIEKAENAQKLINSSPDIGFNLEPLLVKNPQEPLTLLTLSIETGRKHQIRRHLAAIGYPVLGDRLYAKPEIDYILPAVNLQLRAVEMALIDEASGHTLTWKIYK